MKPVENSLTNDGNKIQKRYISGDVGFNINQPVRNSGADLFLMRYSEEHYEIAELVEYNAPCDVLFAYNFEMTGHRISK